MYIEAQLDNLTPSLRESLEILSRVGTIDVDVARKLIPADVFELLEARGLVKFLQGSAHDVVTVVPPLLVERLRSRPNTARKRRLEELILERVGEIQPVAAVHLGNALTNLRVENREALFAGLVYEQARVRTDAASTEWGKAKTPRNAIEYVTALTHSYLPGIEQTVEQVFQQTAHLEGDIEHRAEFIALRAAWLAYMQGDTTAALELICAERPALGVYGRLLDAAEVTILTNAVGVPDGFQEMLETDDGLPSSVQLALLEARMLVLVSACRFAEARLVFEEIRVLDPEGKQVKPRLLYGFILLGEGRHAEALSILTGWFEAAREMLDVGAVRSLSCAIALCHSHSGDYVALDRLADSVAAAGGSTLSLSNPQLGTLQVTTAVVAARRGDRILAERFVSEAQRRGLADGPLPAQSLAWLIAQFRILEGKLREASDVLWASGQKLWGRKAYYTGMLEMFVSIEIHPDEHRAAEVQQLLGEVPESVSLQAQGAYVAALVENDPEALVVAAKSLMGVGRYGLAVSACKIAETCFDRLGEREKAESAKCLGNQAQSVIGDIALDVFRFTAVPAALSYREDQVAKLASAGFTNKEIAGQLFLSVRTVDSHMSRILKKLNLTNRRELEDYFGSVG